MERLKTAALRLDARQFAAYSTTPPTRPEWTAARAGLAAGSLLLVLVVLAGLVTGGWLVLRDFPSLTILPGLVLIAVAWALRPRLGVEDTPWSVITRDAAPTLFALLDRIADAADAPAPHVVALDFEFNASASVAGLRRRRMLTLGLPLWGVLSPGQRVALLGHEFGHFVNGDPTRGLLTAPAVATPGILADMVRPSSSTTGANLAIELAERLIAPLQRLLARGFLLVQAGVLIVALRDRQRAEYCADAVSVRLAGTDAAVALLDDAVAGEALQTAIASAERAVQTSVTAHRDHPGATTWRAAADRVRPGLDLESLRAESVAASTLWQGHPPSGLRARIVESWPHQDPAVELTEEDSARIDAELSRWYAKAGRDLAWS
ncbi:M48 family metallopeptidase [Actinosynnema sp. NPDC020468]|uniref:M48 family metallopeptidase n=1 Tax=Actinosynnema sp. NPDC020468 TaxID=3154488 RepID=UPI003407FA02